MPGLSPSQIDAASAVTSAFNPLLGSLFSGLGALAQQGTGAPQQTAFGGLNQLDLLDIRQRARTPQQVADKLGVTVDQIVGTNPEVAGFLPKNKGPQLLQSPDERKLSTGQKAAAAVEGVRQGFNQLNQVLQQAN